jgi:hypothetical protein
MTFFGELAHMHVGVPLFVFLPRLGSWWWRHGIDVVRPARRRAEV